MSVFSLIKESTGGVTIKQDGAERFFGSQVAPDFYVKGNTIVLTIGRYEYKISTSDNISIDSGSGLSVFSGTITQLKEAVKPVFYKANSGTGGTGVSSYNDLQDKPFTSAEIAQLKQILQVNNPDNI